MAINLTNWVKYIGTQTIPVFNDTVQSVLNLTLDEKSTCKQLANTILKNAALTTRVLRVANSPYYNRCNTHITDILSYRFTYWIQKNIRNLSNIIHSRYNSG